MEIKIVHCKDCIFNVANRLHTETDELSDLTCEYWQSDGLCIHDFCSKGKLAENAENGE